MLFVESEYTRGPGPTGEAAVLHSHIRPDHWNRLAFGFDRMSLAVATACRTRSCGGQFTPMTHGIWNQRGTRYNSIIVLRSSRVPGTVKSTVNVPSSAFGTTNGRAQVGF